MMFHWILGNYVDPFHWLSVLDTELPLVLVIVVLDCKIPRNPFFGYESFTLFLETNFGAKHFRIIGYQYFILFLVKKICVA